MIIDVHAHLGIFAGRSFGAQQFIETLDRYEIAKSCVSSVEALYYCAVSGNDAVLALMEQYPERIIGFCVANPHHQPLAEVKRCLKKGFKGIKLHPWSHNYHLSGSLYRPVFEEAAQQCIPVLFHSGGTLKASDFKYASFDAIVALAEEYSMVDIIIGHMGLGRWQETIEVAAPFKNLYLDITMSLPHANRVELAVQKVGAERVLFGTDMTLLDPAVPLGLIRGSKINQEEKSLILGKNMMRLLHMEDTQ